MAKAKTKQVFKQYSPSQNLLLPPNLDEQGSIDKYKHQQQVSGTRSGYSVTDMDATAMKMKNEEILPAYNVLIGSECQFITGYSVHQKTNDGVCFKDHINQFTNHGGYEPASKYMINIHKLYKKHYKR